jgi:uncharacterized membrane protein YdbT with pleckstrin-like domain
VAFPDDSLTKDEHVVLHLHPHPIVMFVPGFWTVVCVILAAAGVPLHFAPALLIAVGAVALVLFLWLAFWPFVNWRSTHYVFTNERVLLREGVLSRIQHDIPLTRISDVSSSQKFLQRFIGSGQLIVESAGREGQSVLANIPKVVTVQKVVYELVEADHERRTVDEHDLREALREAAASGHDHGGDTTTQPQHH